MSEDKSKESTWRFTHWYPNKDDTAELKGEYMMHGHRQDDTLVLQSDPDTSGAYLLVRLNISGQVASGSWHETAAANGEFAGVEYSGAGQLLITDDGEQMEGLWVGAGIDPAVQKLRLYTNKWELVRIPNNGS